MEPAQTSPSTLTEHRRQIRSLLATIRAVVRRTAFSAESLGSYVGHLSDRLDALARVQEMLMREIGARVDLQELLADELLRQRLHPGNVEVCGPSLLLDSPVAAALALALHELTTNAVKFGQLENPARRVRINWGPHPDREGWSLIQWREDPLAASLPAVDTGGFGFELVRRTLPYEIGAVTTVELTPLGFLCDIGFRADGGTP